jgi:thiol-disulfide isomerase/thioredoxin
VILFVLALTVLLMLAACGDDGNDDGDNAPVPTVDTADAADMVDDEMANDEMADGASAAESEDAVSLVAGRPDAPAPLDGDFRNDPATVFAATGRPQFVEFFTYWCPTCKSIKPTIHALEAEYWGQIDFVYLDRESDANSALVERFGIRGQPVLILVTADGTEVQRWFGSVDADTLREGFDSQLAS